MQTTSNKPSLRLRPAAARGVADFGWLQSAHSFSFGQYYDPKHTGFGNLRVINDDRVSGGNGFGEHPHQNAEIFSYVTKGTLEHSDSIGNGSVVAAGGVQYMSAGSGVSHSEYNPSKTDEMKFLQVWLLPKRGNTPPEYDSMDMTNADKDGVLKLFLSFDGRDGSMQTQAEASVYAATLNGAQVIETHLPPARKGWVQMVRGEMQVNNTKLSQGDGLAITGGGEISMVSGQDAEFLFFDLAP